MKTSELSVIIIISLSLLFINFISAAIPEGPDVLNITANETKPTVSAKMINQTGGNISTLNLTATMKNARWKGFVGWVTGSFTLDDSDGSTLFDWTLSSITGRVYATRNSSTVLWANINCSNITAIETENVDMNQTSANDNISATFNATYNATNNITLSGEHDAFWAANVYIHASKCPTLNTYVNNATSTEFEEMVLYDGVNVLFATILENDETGFDNVAYDFQMIVPEIGYVGFTGATAYYLYVQLD